MAMFYPTGMSAKNNYIKSPIGKAVHEVYKNIKKQCNNCLIGNIVKALNYKVSGNSMDYFYKKLNVKISLAWEIFEPNKIYDLQKQDIFSLIEKSFKTKLKNNKINKLKKDIENENGKINKKSQINELDSDINDTKSVLNECFYTFNPINKKDYDFIINFWKNKLSFFLKEIALKIP